MGKPFLILVVVDLVALGLPTARLGPGVEFVVAVVLGILTGGFWIFRWVTR